MIPEDIAVPVGRLPDALRTISEISGECGLEIAVVAHAGDGNMHPSIVYDPSDGEQVREAYEVFERITRMAIAMGGTVTGEHGVGRVKRHLLHEQLDPEALRLAQTIKQALDPAGILNPGCGF